MIVKLSKLSSAMAKVADLKTKEKNVPGIMLDIFDTGFKLCYAGNGKVFEEIVEATIEEGDPSGRIILGYEEFSRIVEACKPIGNIITEDIQIEFEEGKATVKAEKQLLILNKDGSVKHAKRGSVIEQKINWTPVDNSEDSKPSVRDKVILQSRYDLYRHYDEDYIAEHYPNENEVRPLSDLEFADEADTWDKDELRSIFTRLSTEDNTMMNINPKYNIAFVKLENSCVIIPLRRQLKNKVIQSAAGAKALASILGRMDSSTSDTVTIHTVGDNNVVLTSGDESTIVEMTNLKLGSVITAAKGYMAKDFNKYILNFNRELLENILTGAKMSGSPDKITFSFEYTDDNGIRQVKQENTDDNLEGQTELAPEDTEDSDIDAELEEQFDEDDEDIEVRDSGDVSDEELESAAMAIGDVMGDENSTARYVKMVMTISNTNKAIENKYEILPDVVIDGDGSITTITLSAGLDTLIQAVKGAKTQFIGMDVDIAEGKSGAVSLRIAEIDLKEMAKISTNEKIAKKWPEAKTVEHRKEILGYTTYIPATKIDTK